MSRQVLQQVVCLCLCMAALGAGLSARRRQGPPNNATQQRSDSMAGFVAGTVIDASTGKGVAGALVQLARMSGVRGATAPQAPVITDSQGRFFFTRLMAATYNFTVIKPGWSAVSPLAIQRTTELTDGEKVTDLKIALVKLAVISGVVRDDAGDPVVGMSVTAFRRTVSNGRATFAPMSSSSTDDRGVYRISALQPGAYFVCACDRSPVPFDGTLLSTLASEPAKLMAVAMRAARVGSDVATLDDSLRTYAPTFYPSSNAIARAERISVGAGEDRAGLDITTPAVRAVRISGTVVGAEGPLNASGFALVASGESDEGAALSRIPPMVVQPDGRFDFANVPPGNYLLRVSWSPTTPAAGPTGAALTFVGGRGAPVPPPQPMTPQQMSQVSVKSITMPVLVGDRDITGLTVSLRPGASVSGRVKMANDTPMPAPSEQPNAPRTLVFVTPLNPQPGVPMQNFGTPVNPDGTFRVPAILPGRYRLSITLTPAMPTIASIDIGGVDVQDSAVEITGDLTDVIFTMSTSAPGSLRGTVSGAGVTDGLTALVFPADRRLWTDIDAAYRRFRAVAVTRKGEFTVGTLPSGQYQVAVVPDAQGLDWQDPDKLEALSRTATRVVLAEGERKTVEVKR